MTGRDILEAMTDIRGAYIVPAQERLGYLPAQQAKKPRLTVRTLRRAALLAAVLALLLAALLTTAMAANEDFRQRVFAFFHIGQAVVPEHSQSGRDTPDGPVLDPGTIDVGGVIRGTHIHAPSGTARDGLFLIWAGGEGYRYDAYREENGALVRLEPRSFRREYTVLGKQFIVEFEWVEHGGQFACTYTPSDAAYTLYSLPGGDCRVLVMFQWYSEEHPGARYPALLDPETGELADVLAGTGAETLDIFLAAVSGDRSKMLLSTYEGALYCVDLAAGKLYDVDQLSGEHAQACSLIGNTLSCWVLEGDSVEDARLGSYRAWAIDLTTMERREVFRDVPATAATSHEVWSLNWGARDQDPEGWAAQGRPELGEPGRVGLTFLSGFSTFNVWGNQYAGTRYALEADAGRNVWAVDLTSGERIKVEGWLWPEADYPDIECVPSADGEKVLIRTWKEGTFGELGVLDFVKGTYVQFSRENLNAVSEYDAYWFDSDSVVVCASGGGEEYDYYLYRLLD